jgi:methyl-accepting chemotaxis protein
MFRRLFTVALPGLIAIILISAADLAAFNLLDSAATQAQRISQASATVAKLKNDLVELTVTLDDMTAATTRYSSTLYLLKRANLLSDHQAVAALDLSQLAALDQAQQEQVLISLRALLQDLQGLDQQAQDDQAAGARLWATQVRNSVLKTQVLTNTLADRLAQQAQQLRQDNTTFVLWSRPGLVGFALLTVLASVAMAAWRARSTAQPITRLQQQMALLAAGDLTMPPRPAGAATEQDALALLEQDYLRTIAVLRPVIGRIQGDATHISSVAGELSAASSQQASGARQQEAAISEVTTTIEELHQTAGQIAEAATSVASIAGQALLAANRGQEAVQDSIMGMALIKTRVNDITLRILALAEQSQRINEVVDLIATIAAQTHILALNAAVESASAGEAGQRFSVVAAEVKKLAQRSVAATKDVRTILVQIQAATAAAVMATEEGLKESDRGVTLAGQSGDANEIIIAMVEQTAQLASAISMATQQQRTASEQVVATMREMTEVTRQSAQGSDQAAQAAQQLSDIAHGLRQATHHFAVEVTNGPPPENTPAAPPPGTPPSRRPRARRRTRAIQQEIIAIPADNLTALL